MPERFSSTKPARLAVLLSGSGRTLENLASAIAAGSLPARITLVLSSRAEVYGLERAKRLQLPSTVVARKQYADADAYAAAVWPQIRQAGADYVVLAGFLSLLPIPDDYVGRVVNIHPALLPAFGGPGMFGHHVHEAVLAAGCKVSGCTVHFCDQHYDTGPIIVQRTCPVLDTDDADALAARVFEQETQAYVEALQLLLAGRVRVQQRRTVIDPLPG